jgi:hypothetical protein
MNRRKRIPSQIETEVITQSRRRCCICFGLNQNDGEKKGQIAHLDGNPNNNSAANLAWLCLEHHDVYDGRTSQSKNLTEQEVRLYRDSLYAHLRYKIGDVSSEERKEFPLTTGQRVFVVHNPQTLLRQDLIWAKEMDQLCGEIGTIHTIGYLSCHPGTANRSQLFENALLPPAKPQLSAMIDFDRESFSWARRYAWAIEWLSAVPVQGNGG